jgi:hypothetical protein
MLVKGPMFQNTSFVHTMAAGGVLEENNQFFICRANGIGHHSSAMGKWNQ